MKWIELCIHTTNEASEAISHILYESGASGVAIYDSLNISKANYELDLLQYPENGVYIKCYFKDKSKIDAKIIEIKEQITKLTSFGIEIGANDISVKTIEEKNWESAWKKYYKTSFLTDNITVIPKWEKYNKKDEDEIVIWMDPGMAFGTGTHPTTILSARSLEKYIKPNDIVFDVGCGSGILTIIASKLKAKEIFAFDLDEVAIESSLYNINLNDLTSQIHVRKNDLLEDVIETADLIVANILADVIVELIDDANKRIKKGGIFITSGIIKKEKNRVRKKLKEGQFKIIEELEMDNWITFVSKAL